MSIENFQSMITEKYVHMHILLGLGCIGNVNWKLLNKDGHNQDEKF